jgi:hypothetical protein
MVRLGLLRQDRTIKGICGTDCEQYKHLAEAIADPSKI